MTAIVWADLVLAIPFLIAFIAVPLWVTFRWPDTAPDHTEAHAYLRARTAPATVCFGPRGGAVGDRAPDAARDISAAA